MTNEDTTGVVKLQIKGHNGKTKRDKESYNEPQNNTHKTKDMG
jgi:hypothetical protein